MVFLCSILERAKGQASHCFVFAEVYEECIHANFVFVFYLFFFFLWVTDRRSLYIIFSGGCVYTDSEICMQGETFQQQNSQLGT